MGLANLQYNFLSLGVGQRLLNLFRTSTRPYGAVVATSRAVAWGATVVAAAPAETVTAASSEAAVFRVAVDEESEAPAPSKAADAVLASGGVAPIAEEAEEKGPTTVAARCAAECVDVCAEI